MNGLLIADIIAAIGISAASIISSFTKGPMMNASMYQPICSQPAYTPYTSPTCYNAYPSQPFVYEPIVMHPYEPVVYQPIYQSQMYQTPYVQTRPVQAVPQPMMVQRVPVMRGTTFAAGMMPQYRYEPYEYQYMTPHTSYNNHNCLWKNDYAYTSSLETPQNAVTTQAPSNSANIFTQQTVPPIYSTYYNPNQNNNLISRRVLPGASDSMVNVNIGWQQQRSPGRPDGVVQAFSPIY